MALRILAAVNKTAMAAIAKAQATADNARQMVLNRDVALSDLQADAATLPDIINAAATEHAQINEAWQAGDAALGQRIDDIELTPGPAGKDGRDGVDGIDGLNGRPGFDGAPGRDGKDGSPGPQGIQGAKGDRGDPGPQGQVGPAGNSNLQLEYRDGVAVPAVLSLLGISASVDVAVTWPTPFSDAAYVIVKPQTTAASASLIGKTDAAVKSKTAAGCVITVTTTALLAAGNCTLSVLAYRKG